MVRAYPEFLEQINEIQEATANFNVVPANYAVLLALGTIVLYNNIAIYSTLNQDIILRFGGVNTITILANTTRALDSFPHQGNIEYQYSNVAPTAGTLQVMSF